MILIIIIILIIIYGDFVNKKYNSLLSRSLLLSYVSHVDQMIKLIKPQIKHKYTLQSCLKSLTCIVKSQLKLKCTIHSLYPRNYSYISTSNYFSNNQKL